MFPQVIPPFEVVHEHSIVGTVLGEVLVATARCLVQLYSTVRWLSPAPSAGGFNVLNVGIGRISFYVVSLQSCTMAEISGCLHQFANGMQLT